MTNLQEFPIVHLKAMAWDAISAIETIQQRLAVVRNEIMRRTNGGEGENPADLKEEETKNTKPEKEQEEDEKPETAQAEVEQSVADEPVAA